MLRIEWTLEELGSKGEKSNKFVNGSDGVLVVTIRLGSKCFLLYLSSSLCILEKDKTASKVFCPSCGHKTMKRVACEVLPDGSLKLFLSKNPKCLSSRGTKYVLPNPKVAFLI